jgi:hypothetical protein
VVAVEPPVLEYVVDTQETVAMRVEANTGNTQVSDARIEPDEALVTMRQRHLTQLSDAQRVIVLRLGDLLENQVPGQLFSRTMPLPNRVAGLPVIDVEPDLVAVSVRVVGQTVRRILTGVPVRVSGSPEFLERYDVVPVDPQEWLVDVEVEGDQSRVEALRPSAIRAYVNVSSDLLPGLPETRAPVEFVVPTGIQVLSERTVQLRLVRRENRGS